MFSAETYQNRRKILKKNVSSGVILLLGNIENPINFEHNTYPFRQDSSFLYYVGVREPRLAAVFDIEENLNIVFGDELRLEDLVWKGRQETLREKCSKSGIIEVRPFHLLVDYIQLVLKKNRKVHYLPPYQSHNKILLSQLLDIPIAEIRSSVDLIETVAAQRSVKEAQEIEEIERAIQVSVDMHLLVMQMTKPGMKEYELVNAIQKFAADQCCPLAYPPIVTIHGEILHNQYRQHTIKSGDMILNDSGAETALGYAADLTRTFPVDRSFTVQQKEIYNIVLKAFTSARNMLQPGTRFKDVHLYAAKTLVEGLIELGIMRGDPEEAVQNHVHTLFFQCGLGHLMGLDVHDMEDLGEQYVGYTADEPKDTATFGLKSLRLGKALCPGYVVTIEPGIYIIPDLIDQWKAEKRHESFINYATLERYRNFGGIRIEDDFLITTDSYRLLGPELANTVEEIEGMRS
ncbi:aminopeptidase P family protein [Sphingobacterium sp. DN00404]|uniref:Xaa-Pro aminopeptidase n=2 Tax=Sphingobacterium micropteri TaxID=2763501 RepID=A0ABR7YJ82_9SPHI|nr:aminopeptidase P family protein [Sphingobacterium micropteri]